MAPRALPPALAAVADTVAERLDPGLARVFHGCFAGSWGAAMQPLDDGTVFVATGDIPAMWLRDSAAQVRPYLVAATDPQVYGELAGVLRRQLSYVRVDPYANAFRARPERPDGADEPPPGPLVWERKYELDSLCAPLLLGYALHRAADRAEHLDEEFFQVAEDILGLWRVEQTHPQRSDYAFRRAGAWPGDQLGGGGRGGSVAWTGMTWSGFRPSDDACRYGYHVPANALATVALHALAELAALDGRGALARSASALGTEIRAGIAAHGTRRVAGLGAVYAYEVDGHGGQALLDDANVPSLLSLPYLGFCAGTDPLYRRTRRFVLSPANPHHVVGRFASGIGSPHTPGRRVWPLALTMAALTSDDDAERHRLARLLAATDAGTGRQHESFDVDDPGDYTRPWFGWADALYSELLMELAGLPVRQWFPVLP
ncbi:glycoside hydrolase family 125 protein [Micromonospora sp. 067-2]|uniref:glycoside hydrolase family 125 protein n=1 Tax=Micromonospora sp. 067-2 TaxID=2789270 RepID=UPI00397AC64D